MQDKDLSLRLMRAVRFAANAHAAQKRKSNGEPYVNHLIRVAYQVAKAGLSIDSIEAAVLHDILEDTAVTKKELAAEFSPRVVELVELLTQWWPDDASSEIKKTEVPKYYQAILQDPDAVVIKLFDRADNLKDMERTLDLVPRWAERYLKKSQIEMPPLLKSGAHPQAVEACRRALFDLERAIKRRQSGGLQEQFKI